MSNLLQSHIWTIYTIRAHAKEVWDKSDHGNKGSCQSETKGVTHDSKSDLHLAF